MGRAAYSTACRWLPVALALALGAGPAAGDAAPTAVASAPPDAAPSATASPPAAGAPQPDPTRLPPAPVPDAVLERLPPGARPAAERAGLERVPAARNAPEHLVESVEVPPGDDAGDLRVEYTVDPALEDRIRELLERDGVALGTVILMDARSGVVHAYVSTDPQRFPATRPYPTASLMKLVTAAAALRSEPEVADRRCRYRGSPYQLLPASLVAPTHGGWVEPFWEALAVSNNQCFARLAVHDVGEDALLAEMGRLGLLDPPAPGHAPGRVEPVEGPLALGRLGSGLAGSFVTPLAAARLAAVLARGELVTPRWVAGVRDARGRPLRLPEPAEPRPVWPPALAAELREHMVEVTESGTARRGFTDGRGSPRLGDVRVAGKTGTLSGDDPPGRYRWFIGVAPAEAPRIAVAAVVVDGPAGGTAASEVAAETLGLVFCGDGDCDAGRAERLHERVALRLAAHRDALARAERLAAAERARLAALAEERRVRELSELDAPPRPLKVVGFDFPRSLRGRKANGQIVLVLELSPEGEVTDVQVDSSDLPDFTEFVTSEVRGWRFTPPTRQGRPVSARARLPIAIHIN